MQTPTSSAAPGVLHSVILDGRGGAREIDVAEVERWQPGDGHLWVHLDVNDADSERWLLQQQDLPQAVVDALVAGESRPWTMLSEHWLMANLRGVNTNPGSDPEDMVSLRIWTDGNRIYTARRRRLLSVVDIADDLRAGKGPSDPSDLFGRVVERMFDRIGEFVDSIENRIDHCEEQLETDNVEDVRRELAETRRQLASVRRFLAPQRDALDRMNRRPPAVLSADDALALVQEADRITRFLEDLDLARERVIALQEDIMSQLAQEQNSRMYVLSVVAAVFLPLTFITGLLGMNVGGLPGLEHPNGFMVSIVLMGAAAVLTVVFFRWKKWL